MWFPDFTCPGPQVRHLTKMAFKKWGYRKQWLYISLTTIIIPQYPTQLEFSKTFQHLWSENLHCTMLSSLDVACVRDHFSNFKLQLIVAVRTIVSVFKLYSYLHWHCKIEKKLLKWTIGGHTASVHTVVCPLGVELLLIAIWSTVTQYQRLHSATRNCICAWVWGEWWFD